MINEWINITARDQLFRYEVEMEIYTGKIRYRKIYNNGMCGDWKDGEPEGEEDEA